MVTSIVRKFQNQYAAAFAGSLSMMVSGACFVWATPVLPLFNGKDALIPMSTTEISWMISLIEFGSLFSPALAGYLSEKLGRKPAILVAGPFIIIGWVLILVTRDAPSLFIVRILHGFGMGVLFTIVPIYLGEIAAVNVRGGLTSLLQTMWYTGFLFQYVVGSYLSYDNSALVNLIFSSAVFAMFFLLQPETPFYLIMKNKDEKANKSLMLLRGKTTFDEIAAELKMIKDTVEKDMKSKFKWSDLFNLSKVDIRVIVIVQVLALFRLCSGTISISAYLSELLREADWEFISPELTMTIYSCITLASIIIAMVVVDHVGRRPLLLISCAATAVSSLSLSIFYWINDFRVDIDLDSYRWFPTVGFITFTMFFAIGLGPVTQIMQSELFPMNIRALGNVITSYNLTFASFVCLRFYQIMVDNFGVYSNFLFFAISSLTGLYVIYMYVPETKGKTFLEISEYFSQKANKTKSNHDSNA